MAKKPQMVKHGKIDRLSYSRIREVMEMPDFIEIQKKSYQWFLDVGLREVFRDIGTITDYNGNLELSFYDYEMKDTTKYTIKECKERDATYASSLRVFARLYNKATGEVKESPVFMGDFPRMTENGTFVINGAERVVASQLVRSPGIYYTVSHDKLGKELFATQIIPNRGAWLEFETDQNDIFYVKIDKGKKVLISTFIRALLYGSDYKGSDSELYDMFGDDDRMSATIEKDDKKDAGSAILAIYKVIHPGEPPQIETAQSSLDSLLFDSKKYDLSRVGRYKYNKKLAISSRIAGFVAAEPIFDPGTGELLADVGEKISSEKAAVIEQAGVDRAVLLLENDKRLVVISNGMVDPLPYLEEHGFTREELLDLGINEKVRFGKLTALIGQAVDEEMNKEDFTDLLSDNLENLIPRHVIREDIFASINYLTCLANGVGVEDDIDHLGNRRVRCVGELLQNQVRTGFVRMERSVKEKMNTQAQDAEKITPTSLISARSVTTAVKDFFGSSPLSQFMDQNNPLAELTNKRRLSALGPGGLSRDRAGFEVRDVHYSHYGRMCPIETPEGPNIGLISYLATFAKINEYGFIEAPYRKVDKATGRVLDEVEYMTADVEDKYIIAQANEPLDADNYFVNDTVHARNRDNFVQVEKTRVDYMDVSPKMVVSVATAMIPFLENDDANRALMGSNMQRQAVPLLRTESPIVATGMEYKAAVDSGAAVVAKRAGKVAYVSADRIEILTDDKKLDRYELIKFQRSNQGTCINQKPVVNVGQYVEAKEVIADGPATNLGEISLGRNALVGFTTWEGYNYEDAVLVNEKLVRDDIYTSIHIEKYDIEARDTKLGPEQITRDIPNVGDDALKNLDANGIIRIGAEVHSGDILVGKVTPKAETEQTAENKLLLAIFGKKSEEVRDTSLRLPHGAYGIVVDIQELTPETSDELNPGVNKVVRCYIAQKRKLSVGDKMAGRHGNKGVVSRILPMEDMPFLPDGTPLDIVLNPLGVPSRMNIGQVLEVHLGFASRHLGVKVMTPVFDGAHEEDIIEAFVEANKKLLREAQQKAEEKGEEFDPAKVQLLRDDCKTILTDGRTGRKFDNPVTVGVMYYLKLHHLVDDKIHARSTGSYALITQQPLGGKAQFGGQRFGEMEVWALEAYGAAYTLQEILTVKSDDIIGRTNTYKAISQGQNISHPGVPEAFRVLIKELQALGLSVRVLDAEDREIDIRQSFDGSDTSLHLLYEDEATGESSRNDSVFLSGGSEDLGDGFTVEREGIYAVDGVDEDEIYSSDDDDDGDDEFYDDEEFDSDNNE